MCRNCNPNINGLEVLFAFNFHHRQKIGAERKIRNARYNSHAVGHVGNIVWHIQPFGKLCLINFTKA